MNIFLPVICIKVIKFVAESAHFESIYCVLLQTTALEISPADTKALFRQCQAQESLGEIEEAFKNARRLNQLEPSNTAVQTMLRKLGEQINDKVSQVRKQWDLSWICRRSDYIIGFIAPAIGPNKSKKLTRLIMPVHNMRSKVWMKNNVHGFTDRQLSAVKPCTLFFILKFAAYIVCRCYKPCEFPGFVWTDCWGNKSYYVITSPAPMFALLAVFNFIVLSCHSEVIWSRSIFLQCKTS